MRSRSTLLLTVGLVWAAVGAPARAQPACPLTGTLADLVALGPAGCAVHDKIFSHFVTTFTSTGFTSTLTSADVAYTILNPTPWAHGLQFSAPWFAPAGGILDQSLQYRVRTSDEQPRITSLRLAQFGEFVLGSTEPTGFVSINEDVCVGDVFVPASCSAGTVRSLATLHSARPALYGPDRHVDAENWYPGVAVIDVNKDLMVYGGDGGAGLSIMTQFVTQAPEPASLTLVGTGAVLLIGVALRRRVV